MVHLLPTEALWLSGLLLAGTALGMKLEKRFPLWLKLAFRFSTLTMLTLLLVQAVGSPVAARVNDLNLEDRVWVGIIKIGWWFLCARAAIGLVMVFVIVENRPRETRMISDLLAAAIYIATALLVVEYVFRVPVGSLMAASGVVAIIIGLALQSTLADVFSGIAVGLERVYKPGDLIWVEGGIEGHIIERGWRSTFISTPHNSVAVVPNSVIAKSRLENRSAPTPTREVVVMVSVDPSIDPPRCADALRAAVLACQFPLPHPKPTVHCSALQGDGAIYEIRFIVDSTAEVLEARTELLGLVHRHLRCAGISLSVAGIAPCPSRAAPTLEDLIAESDAFGQLAPDEQSALAARFQAIFFDEGAQLFRQGDRPDELFMLFSGVVSLAHSDSQNPECILVRAGPGATIGLIGLIAGVESPVNATALTPVSAFRLDCTDIAAVLRVCPGLAASLEAQAARGDDWFRSEIGAHRDVQLGKPDVLLCRVRQFLQRLNS
jgi:small-conductance mechanosensitive channel